LPVRSRSGVAAGSLANWRSSVMPSTRTRWRSTCRGPLGRHAAHPRRTAKTFLRNHLAGTIAIDFLTSNMYARCCCRPIPLINTICLLSRAPCSRDQARLSCSLPPPTLADRVEPRAHRAW
jgi:hypothetical protein